MASGGNLSKLGDFALLTDEDVMFELTLRGFGAPGEIKELREDLINAWEDKSRSNVETGASVDTLLKKIAEFELVLFDATLANAIPVRVLHLHLLHRVEHEVFIDDPGREKSKRIGNILQKHMKTFEASIESMKIQLQAMTKGAIPKQPRASDVVAPIEQRENTVVDLTSTPTGPKDAPIVSENPLSRYYASKYTRSVHPNPAPQPVANNPEWSMEYDTPNLTTHQTPIFEGNPLPPPPRAPDFFSAMRPAPYKDWGISFTGQRGGGDKKVSRFLREIERMSAAQGVPLPVLNRAVRLFLKDDALLWYDAVYHNLTSWQAFSTAIRSAFQDVESDFSIRQRIEERKQKSGEAVEVFIAAMVTLFEDLEQGISEQEKIRLIRRNLLPSFSNALALTNIVSIPQLVELLKQIERNRLYCPPANKSRNNSRGNREDIQEVSAPSESQNSSQQSQQNSQQQKQRNSQSQNTQKNATQGQNNKNLKVKKNRDSQSGPLICVNCAGEHNIRDCTQPRKCNVMCYRCGLENTITSKCPVCNSSQGEGAAAQ
ncbi:uncharacterized protein LOC129795869 [Lutzomyia longipalpis]|uniref:uncharacterized protein LOC129795869 n=1 Tax=Lutzomyia longipalpis TaxID=7200 RepID=UPI0024844FCD|nr:uncharacterized protein LOC129795869 [Lutzomyia longipalpis]